MKRCFLGITLPENIKLNIDELKKDCQLDCLPIKLVELENSHIAIKFFGDLTDEQIELASQAIIVALTDSRPFQIVIKDIVVFPNFYQPRVLALKVISPDLEPLAKKIFVQLDKLDFIVPEQRKYTPHITLGRIKDKLTDAEKEQLENIKFEHRLTVQAIQLFESRLTASGPIYKVLQEFKLK